MRHPRDQQRIMQYNLLGFILGCLFWLASPSWAMDAQSEAALKSLGDHERQLSAIRSAIIRSAQDAPTQVYSTAWIDASGSLNETSFFNSDARIRGVRIQSYLDQNGRFDEQRVAADLALPAYLRKGVEPSVCADQNRRWRMPIALQFSVVAGVAPQDEGLAAWLTSQISHETRQLSSSSARWFVSRPFVAPSRQGGQAYWQAFLGTPVDQTDWQLQIMLDRIDRSTSPSVRAVLRDPSIAWKKLTTESAPQAWRLSLTLMNSRTGETRWGLQKILSSERAPEQHAGALDMQAIRSTLDEWMREMEMKIACEPIHYTLSPVASGNPRAAGPAWAIRVSEQSGLKTGDRLLVIDRQHVPARLFEPEAIRRVVLAEVSGVGVRQVELRQLAGPPLAKNGDWVALPL